MNRTHPRADEAITELRAQFGARCSVGESVRMNHGHGEALSACHAPDAVVWPENTADVQAVARICSKYAVPLIPFGAGTSIEGQVNAPFGGICLDLTRMNQVIEVHAEDADCVVQPGITREGLNAYLRDTGHFFPIDPGANATIGGMLSTRASGTTTVRYGTMSQNVLALEAVLADGRVVRCGTRARKSAAGYDLVHVFVGAEGTLGIVTEITLRIHPVPEQAAAAICSFPSLRDAVDIVIELIQSGSSLARVEFLDHVQIRACNLHSQLSLPEEPTLFLEFHGTRAGVEEQSARAQDVAASHGGKGFLWAVQPEERSRLWKARHTAYFAARALRPGSDCIVSDVCVPISALAESVAETRKDLDDAGLLATILGHVGDGNYHVLMLVDPDCAEERQRSEAVYSAMIERALKAGGTCTGEHGIGLGKREELVAECGRDTVDLMQALKRAWDPQGILNPGKIFL